MAIASLANFTVPLASDQSATSQGLLMPKLKYRFRLSFENFGVSTPTTELTKQVISAARPNVQFEDQTIHIYNSQIHYAGKPKWQTITVKLRDDATGQVSKLVGEQMQKQFDFYEQSSAASGLDYKFTLRIEMLDGGNGASTPTILESWECYGVYVSQVNYESLDYSQQGPAEITLTLQMDNAVQTPSGSGLGSASSIRPAVGGTLATGGGQ